MCAPSRTRSAALDTKGDFRIAVTAGATWHRQVAPARRRHARAASVDSFRPLSALAITFNGKSRGAYHYPISVRVLRQFFCLTVPGNSEFDRSWRH
jgi:hypothetical protein